MCSRSEQSRNRGGLGCGLATHGVADPGCAEILAAGQSLLHQAALTSSSPQRTGAAAFTGMAAAPDHSYAFLATEVGLPPANNS